MGLLTLFLVYIHYKVFIKKHRDCLASRILQLNLILHTSFKREEQVNREEIILVKLEESFAYEIYLAKENITSVFLNGRKCSL
jgi:hypothetical protein